MKTKSFFLILFVIVRVSCAQYLPQNNLVANPHFDNLSSFIAEHPSQIPCVTSYITMACSYINENSGLFHAFCLHDWVRPSLGSTWWRHIDSCSYYPYPESPFNKRASVSFSLFSLSPNQIEYRQYVQGLLTDSLQKDHTYCVSFYVMLDTYTYYGTDYYGAFVFATSAIGAYFSKYPIYKSNHQPFFEFYPVQVENQLDNILLDNLNWMLVSSSFIAEGGEKYITIGNFLPDSLTPFIQFKENYTGYVSEAFYLMGFVGVYDCTGHSYQCNAGEDMRICNGQVVQLGTEEDNRRQYHWSPAIGLSDTTAARPLASPSETTTYYLYVIDEFFQESYDTVTVEVVQCEIFIPNIFSPNGDGENDVLYVRGQGIEQLTFVVYNRWGHKMFETKDPNHGWDGTHNGKPAETGVYVWHVHAKLEDGLELRRSGNVTLVR